jgi:hypothetical protein
VQCSCNAARLHARRTYSEPPVVGENLMEFDIGIGGVTVKQ